MEPEKVKKMLKPYKNIRKIIIFLKKRMPYAQIMGNGQMLCAIR